MPETLDGPRAAPASGGPARQLVVICHGVGADGQDLIDLAPYWARALPDAAFVAPNGPARYDMAPPDYPHARQWFSLADRSPDKMAAGAEQARAALDPFIDAELARLGLAPGAYALAGFSQGAMTVLHAGLRRATPPRAILAFSGALLTPVPKPPPATEVLLVHGEADDVVPVQRSRDAEAALRASGVPVEAVWRPRVGHSIDEVGLSQGALLLQRVFAQHDGRVNP